jgi:hypothetical protein
LIFSKLIDHYALYRLHNNRSEEYQYSSLPTSILDIKERESFYKVNPIDVIFNIHHLENGYKTGTFEFQSLVSSGDISNDYLEGEAYLSVNEDEPNIIFVQGWRQDSFDRLKKIFHKPINNLGWNMYYFPLPYHFGRKPENSLYSGEYMISANIQRTLVSVRQAVVDLRALIQWIKSNKKGPIVVIGLSLGGFITNLTATLESQIDVLVSIFYSNRLSYSIWNTEPGKFIKADLEHHGVNYNDLVKYWRITEPSQAIPKMDKDNILLISAQHDQYVHIEDADYLYKSWGRPTRFIYKCGHAGIALHRRKIAKDTLSFLQKKFK